MDNRYKVLIVDDQEEIRKILFKHLSIIGYDVVAAASIEEANRIIKSIEIDFAIVDLQFLESEDFGGKRIIKNINKIQPLTKILVLSGYQLTPELKEALKDLHYNHYLCKGASSNIINLVIEKLEKYKKETTTKQCFVIMPFSNTTRCSAQEWSEIFEHIIKPAVEECGYAYECNRNNYRSGNIIKNIMVNINSSDVLIADLTDQNANVFYELGVRHTLNFPTIIITQDLKDVPIDLQGYMCIEYNTTPGGINELKMNIKDAIEEIENARKIKRKINYSPVGDFLEFKT
jgi:ActR/RegA family two-component response regulator